MFIDVVDKAAGTRFQAEVFGAEGLMARAPLALFAALTGWIAEHEKDAAMAPFVAGVKRGTESLQAATMWLAANGMQNPNDAGAGATGDLPLYQAILARRGNKGAAGKPGEGGLRAEDRTRLSNTVQVRKP